MIINALGYLDKTRLSIVNKHLLTIFNNYKYNIHSDEVLDITNNYLVYPNLGQRVKEYKEECKNILLSSINKYPNIKIHLSNDHELIDKYHNNIYSYTFDIEQNKNQDILKFIYSLSIKELYVSGTNIPFSFPNNLNKIELDCCSNLTDISSLGNIDDLSIYKCNNIVILPQVFNSKKIVFRNCNFLNNDNINIIKNTYELSILKCPNITDLRGLDLSTIKRLSLEFFNIIVPKLDNLEYLSINDSVCTNINYLGDNIKELHLSYYNLQVLPTVKYVEELYINNSQININLDGFDNLRKLKIVNNLHITDLFDIKNIKNLNLQQCNNLINIDSLKNIEYMDELILSSCHKLVDISPLKNIESINELNLSHCSNLVDISPLKNIKSINELNLSWCCKLVDISPLKNIESINELNLSYCSNIIDISLLKNIKINELGLYGCYNIKN